MTDTLGAPLSYCYVSNVTARSVALCDDSGRFRLTGMAAGPNTIEVRRLGYAPGRFTLDIAADSTLHVVIQLLPLATVLQPLDVTAQGLSRSLVEHGFYERLRAHQIGLSTGTFITPEEFEALNPNRVTDAFQARAGLTLVYNDQLAVPWGRGGRCLLNVYVDGIEIRKLYEMPRGRSPDHVWLGEPGVTIGEGNRVTGIGIDGFIQPKAVKAIEIYPSGPETPIQFQSFNSCGAIVIWTKKD